VLGIEFVIVHDGDQPDIIEKMASGCSRLIDAKAIASSLFSSTRERHRQNPPDGYQIRNDNGDVVLRSWETQRRSS
jgi:hypothetical protein